MAYNNEDDITVTVDPIRRDHWVYDGYDKHAATSQRGEALNRAAYFDLASWDPNGVTAPSFFMPTIRQIDVADKYVVQPTDPFCPGWEGPRSGKLPVIMQQLYDGSLINKSVGVIDHERREAARTESARIFDTSEGPWGRAR